MVEQIVAFCSAIAALVSVAALIASIRKSAAGQQRSDDRLSSNIEKTLQLATMIESIQSDERICKREMTKELERVTTALHKRIDDFIAVQGTSNLAISVQLAELGQKVVHLKESIDKNDTMREFFTLLVNRLVEAEGRRQ